MVSWDYNEFIYKPQNSVQTSSFMWYPFSNHLLQYTLLLYKIWCFYHKVNDCHKICHLTAALFKSHDVFTN